MRSFLAGLLAGALSRASSAWTVVRRRPRSAASVGFVSVAAIGLLVAMFLSDGFRATSYDLDDASVWATKRDGGLVGRINTQIAKQDAVITMDVADDVVQDGRSVFVVDQGAGQLRSIAVDTLDPQPPPGVKLPEQAIADLAAGTLVVATPSGNVWIGEVTTAASLGADERDPDLELGAGGAVAVGRGGDVVAYSSTSGEVSVTSGDERITSISGPKGSVAGQLQVSMAGDVPVLLDTTSGTLYLPDDTTVDLSRFGAEPQLQLPGDDSSQVLVATDEGLISVPIESGEPSSVSALVNSGPVRPVRMAGCSFGAWQGTPVETVVCDGHDPVTKDLPTGNLRFRVNRQNVILNGLENGEVWLFVDGEIRQSDDWTQDAPDDSEEKDPESEVSKVLDHTEENKPPEANDDALGARPALPAVLTVLDNDVDENGDVLVITSVDGVPDGVDVAIVGEGQALQFQAPAGATGPYQFTYTITDGRAAPNSDIATVRVEITPDGENHPPERKPNARPSLKVESAKSATYDVLQDWVDPDGDPIFLEGATVEGFPDVVQTLPTGLLTFNDSGTGTGAKTVKVSLRDAPAAPGTAPQSVTGDLPVMVEAPNARIAPVARPDFRATVVGATVRIEPLLNDTDGNGDELRLGRLDIEGLDLATTTVTMSEVDDSVTFSSQKAGSFLFGYEVTDGVDSTKGLIRVDVAEPTENRPPSAGRDLVVLPVQAGAVRTIDLLVNDVDPDGDVMVVKSVSIPSGSESLISAQLLEHRRLRVSVKGQLASPIVLTYVLSDGQAESRVPGQVVVVSTPAAVQNRPPVLADDAVSVRAGDVVSIPVLANDVDPEGDDLRIDPTLVTPPAEGQGVAFVSGSVVRFVAPDRPMTVRLAYGVSDGVNVDSAQIVVSVRSGDDNTAPLARTIEARVLAGGTVRIPIPLAGIDADGDSVTLEGLGVIAPQLGRVVTPVAHDSITYEAFPSASGRTDSFAYRIVDRRGATAEGVVRVGVAPRSTTNGAPQPFDDYVEVEPGGTVRVPVLANDYDPDGDPLSFGRPALEVPEGLRAEVDGVKVSLTAPDEVRQIQPLVYYVTDGRGDTVSAKVNVVVKEDAVGLAPIARDDEARPPAGIDARTVEVDVTANDDDPDGVVEDLRVELVGSPSGVSVEDRKLVAELIDSPRLVVYRITDRQELSATAIARIPAQGSALDRPPVQRPDAPDLEAVDGTPTVISIGDFVVDPEGKPVRLTTGDRVSATHSNSGELVTDETTLTFTSEPGYTGAASITFEVTDGDAADTGNRVVVSLPISVRSETNTAPSFEGGLSLSIAPKEDPQTIDLAPLVTDPDPGDLEKLSFAKVDDSGAPLGVTVELSGSVLSAVADGDAVADTTGVVTVSVTDGHGEPVVGTVALTVVQSRRPLPSCNDAVIEKADAGSTVRRDVLADCYNPFPDEALEVGAVMTDLRYGTATVSGGSVEFTPAKGFVDTALISYTVRDAVGRTAKGLISVTVRDVPGKPSPPTVVTVSSRRVVLTWSPPETNGAPIDRYEVSSSHGTTTCETTTCEITGLVNDTTYRFTVRAHNEVGDGEPSDPSGDARPDQRPEAPTNPVLTFDTTRLDGQLTATWDAAATEGSPVTAYELQISPPPASGSATIALGAVTSHQLTGLTNGTSYRVRIRAINAAPEPSDWSVDSNAETPAKVPDQPVITTVQRVNDRLGELIEVRWTAPAANGDAISGYTLEAIRQGTTTPARTLQVAGSALSQIVDVDDYRGAYAFRLTATNKAGRSLPSTLSQAVQAEKEPATIGAVSAVDKLGTVGLDRRANITFARPDDGGKPLTSYQVRINGGSTQTFTTAALLTAANPTLTVTGLTNSNDPNASYRFAVRACNETLCQQAYGQESDPPVRPFGPVGTPSVAAGKPNPDQVSFNWSPPAANGRAITGMQISINGGGWEGVGTSGGRTVGNGRNQTWSIRVRAVDAEGNIGPEGSASATTDPPPPPPPPTISASWGANASAAGCSGCTWVNYSLRNFPPNAAFTIDCTDNGAGWYSSAGRYLITTDASGNFDISTTNVASQRSCFWGYARGNVQIVVNGVWSNRI